MPTTDREHKNGDLPPDSSIRVNQEALEPISDVGSWRAAIVVTVFAIGLLAVGALRYANLHSENPPAVAAYATLIYIGLTVLASILLIRSGGH